jgi:hypothetical protein
LSGVVWRKYPSGCGFGCSLRLPVTHFILCVAAAPIVGRMVVFSVSQLAVAAFWGWGSIPFLGAILVEVTAPTPQTARRLSAVRPDVAKPLAVVALREASLSVVCLYLNWYVAKAVQFISPLFYFYNCQTDPQWKHQQWGGIFLLVRSEAVARQQQQWGGVFVLVPSETVTGRGGSPLLFAFRKTPRKRQHIGQVNANCKRMKLLKAGSPKWCN